MKSLRCFGQLLAGKTKTTQVSSVVSMRSMVTQSKVVHCDLEEIKIPDTTFSQLCWSREEVFKDRLALVMSIEVSSTNNSLYEG